MNGSALSQQFVRGKKGREKKGEIKEVVFDDAARREYLTGFHKRNLAKKGVNAAKAKERQRQARLEFRREKRRELAERASANARAVERACGNNSDDDQHLNVAGPLDEDEELEFEDEEQLATVTVIQDFDISDTGGIQDRSGGNDLGDESDDRGPAAIPRSISKHITSTRSTPAQKTAPRKETKKRVAYETKAARAVAKAKQRARHEEKKERGRSKSKSSLRGRSRHSR